jgi:hypothetical protein
MREQLFNLFWFLKPVFTHFWQNRKENRFKKLKIGNYFWKSDFVNRPHLF